MGPKLTTNRRSGLTSSGWLRWASLLAIGSGVGFAACSDEGGASDANATTVAPVMQVTVAESNFCDKMAQIRVDALSGGDADPQAVAAQYREALPQAPEAIRGDLETLIETLETGNTAPPTEPLDNDDLDGEGWQPSADPAVRVLDYVESHCSGIASNPGPAATQPP